MQNKGKLGKPANHPQTMIDLQLKYQAESIIKNQSNKVSLKSDLKPDVKPNVKTNVKQQLEWNEQSISVKNITWNKHDEQSMLFAQTKLNQFMIENNFVVDQDTQKYIRMLTEDMKDVGVSTCNVCGDRQSRHTHMNIEHMHMKVNWGYESCYDCETHTLVLCCNCYKTHIMNSTLGKFVQVKRYM